MFNPSMSVLVHCMVVNALKEYHKLKTPPSWAVAGIYTLVSLKGKLIYQVHTCQTLSKVQSISMTYQKLVPLSSYGLNYTDLFLIFLYGTCCNYWDQTLFHD
jgi:hypothetical protein